MANIMITEKCNLSCPYCFANEFVNKEQRESTDIELNVFSDILDFILRDGSDKKIGLIGGEPTCHKNFSEIINILNNEKRAEKVIIYTNGINVIDFVNILDNPKYSLLINCNDILNSQGIGGKFLKSLDASYSLMKDRITLGANFYKIDYNYDYILKIIDKYPCKNLRVSISVPNNKTKAYNPLDYFLEIKPRIFKFFKELKQRGTIPFLDCNIFPACLISSEDLEEFAEWGAESPFSILKNHQTGCMPVIDILRDYTAVRCFGLSEYTKENIKNFASISDLRNYYLRTVDALAINTFYDSKCSNCYKFNTMKCSGGCLIYKIDKIKELQQRIII